MSLNHGHPKLLVSLIISLFQNLNLGKIWWRISIKLESNTLKFGTRTKEKLEDSEMKKNTTRKGDIMKRIRSNCKPKTTKRTCKRNIYLEENEPWCPTDIDKNSFCDDTNNGGFFVDRYMNLLCGKLGRNSVIFSKYTLLTVSILGVQGFGFS
jgi:hypothetical protein